MRLYEMMPQEPERLLGESWVREQQLRMAVSAVLELWRNGMLTVGSVQPGSTATVIEAMNRLARLTDR